MYHIDTTAIISNRLKSIEEAKKSRDPKKIKVAYHNLMEYIEDMPNILKRDKYSIMEHYIVKMEEDLKQCYILNLAGIPE